MLNIINKSKLFLAVSIFAAMASFSYTTKADVEIDCSGKEGYQLTICEQQKALAEKNAKSNKNAEKKATDKANKAKTAEADATKAREEAEKKKAAEQANYLAASDKAAIAAADKSEADKAKAAAQKEMNDAIARGDTAAAQTARDKMAEADKKSKEAASRLSEANKAKDDAKKAEQKAENAAKKAEDNAKKAQRKADDEKIDAAEKAEDNANDDLKDAKKKYKKLQDKCTKKPDKCDVDALQKAKVELDAAQANADAAKKNREDIDGTTAEKEKQKQAAAELAAAKEAEAQQNQQNMYSDIEIEEEDINEAEIQAYNCKDSTTGESCTLTADNANTCKCEYKEVYTDEEGNTKEGKIGTFDELDANGNPVAMQRCYEAKENIFHYIACKAMTTLADVRVIVYTLAGFGLIAFAFAAIFNKISWKHLANLCIALFILSMMTPFINYFTHENSSKGITYGNYLPAGFTNISGSDMEVPTECNAKKGDICPDVSVDTSAKDSKWSWKDLKNTVKTGINAAKKAYDTYKTVKNTVETVVDQTKKIGTAIKNSEGGLSGIMDTLGEVATASNTIFNATKTGAAAVVSNTASIANDVQDLDKSSAELAFDKENKDRIKELETKLAAGNLTPEQQEWAKAELEQRKAAVDSNKVTDWANNQGQKALDKINSVANTGAKVADITTKASNAAQTGATIGGGIGTATGDVLGTVFGVATAAGEAIGAVEDNKQAKIDAANAEAQKKAAAETAAKKQEEVRKNNASYSQGKQWNKGYNANMQQNKPAAQKPAVSSGNKTSGSKGSSGNNNTAGNNSVTKTVTVTTGGRGDQIEDVGPYLPETTTTTTITLENAVQNEDGTITIRDENGTHGTFDKEGNLLSTVNYVTGKQWSSEPSTNSGYDYQKPIWGQGF